MTEFYHLIMLFITTNKILNYFLYHYNIINNIIMNLEMKKKKSYLNLKIMLLIDNNNNNLGLPVRANENP